MQAATNQPFKQLTLTQESAFRRNFYTEDEQILRKRICESLLPSRLPLVISAVATFLLEPLPLTLPLESSFLPSFHPPPEKQGEQREEKIGVLPLSSVGFCGLGSSWRLGQADAWFTKLTP
jgi:hypothetical protein